jgi:hypothetical protein
MSVIASILGSVLGLTLAIVSVMFLDLGLLAGLMVWTGTGLVATLVAVFFAMLSASQDNQPLRAELA